MPQRPHFPFLLLLLFALSLLMADVRIGASAFRFTARPGRKCFTAEIPSPGRYVVQYRMPRSLTPLVSVAVSTREGRALLEHPTASTNAQDVITVYAEEGNNIAVCFHVSEKAPSTASAMHIALDVLDAEEAELTHQRRHAHSISIPIGVGVSNKSGAMQQMQYVFNTVMQIRQAYIQLMGMDRSMQESFDDINTVAWLYMCVFGTVAVLIVFVGCFRL